MIRRFLKRISKMFMASIVVLCGVHSPAADLVGSEISTRIETPQAASSQQKRMLFRYNIGLDGDSYSDERDRVQFANFVSKALLRYRLDDEIEIRAQSRIQLVSGQVQTVFGDNVPVNGILLKEAVVIYKPFQFFALSAGAIDQIYLEAPLVVSERPFPGAQEKVKIGDRSFAMELVAEQAIPTSVMLSTQTANIEPTPYFFAETIGIKSQIASDFEVHLYGTHYEYSNLPSKVAIDSEPFGNSVVEQGLSSSVFKYDFGGVLGGGDVSWRPFRRVKFSIGAQVIENLAAPESVGTGYLSFLSSEIQASGNLILEPKFIYFFNESDTAPAFYNDSVFGHNNRQGYGGEMVLNFLQSRYKIKARYMNADLINANLYQSREQNFMLMFETYYEHL